MPWGVVPLYRDDLGSLKVVWRVFLPWDWYSLRSAVEHWVNPMEDGTWVHWYVSSTEGAY